MSRSIKPGDAVVVRDAMGRLLRKVATTAPRPGGDFAVVCVRWPDGEEDTPWPFEDVWFADGAAARYDPEGRHSIRPEDALTREEYNQTLRRREQVDNGK